jgi:hypothetical protein
VKWRKVQYPKFQWQEVVFFVFSFSLVWEFLNGTKFWLLHAREQHKYSTIQHLPTRIWTHSQKALVKWEFF